MKLSRVYIKNYRSISDVRIDFDFGCQVLLGVNESGKSNILAALHTLDPAVPVGFMDLRQEQPGEDIVDTGRVQFRFVPSAEEVEKVCEALKVFFPDGRFDVPIVIADAVVYSLRDLVCERLVYFCSTHIPSGSRTLFPMLIMDRLKVLSGWYINNKTSNSVIYRNSAGSIIVEPNHVVHAHEEDKIPIDLKVLDEQDLSNFVCGVADTVLREKLPKCIYWRYSEKYLLPGTVDIDDFVLQPETCVPLLIMFELAGLSGEALAEAINSTRKSSRIRYTRLLASVAEATTRHIRSIWKDYENIKFELLPDGDNVLIQVTEDLVPLEMVQRSDGFKRFVSFLLQVSSKVKLGDIANCLILVDEPETALHPAGAKSLMDELVRIGESNAVVYSTHSIFMVDREHVGRHLLVRKNGEVTGVKRAEKSRIYDEQVLYAAVGYSVFESLKRWNVIFEGWRDKEIFRIAAASVVRNSVDYEEWLSKIGLTYAEGVKDIKNVVCILELANRECLIVSDADKPALEKRREYESPASWGRWLTLQDIFGDGSGIFTGEDLIRREAVVKRTNDWLSKDFGVADLELADLKPGTPTIDGLKEWLRKAGIEGRRRDDVLNGLKTALYDGLTSDELRDEAEKYVIYVLRYFFKQ